MDPNTPKSSPQQSDNGLIMPEVTAQPVVAPQPATNPEPTPIPVATPAPTATPAPEPTPELAPVATPEPTSVPVSVTAEPAPVVEPAPVPEPAPEPVAVAEPAPVVAEEVPVATPEPTPVAEPEPEPTPAAAPAEADPLFEPVTEADPLDVVPEPVAPTPTPPVTDQAMNQLDDGAQPVVAATGQTVIAASTAHKSRKKTMLILVIGILLAGAVGFAAYTYFAQPNVAETTTPAAILSVDQLSPESLTQATDKAELAAGSQTNAAVLVFSGKTPADAPQDLKLEIEIQPLGTDFTGTPTEDTIAVPDEADPLKVTVTDYAAGSYHWRGRLSDGTSNGPWVAYNTAEDAGKTADFTIDRTAPAAAALKTANGKAVAGKTITSTVTKPVMTGTSEAGTTITVAYSETLSYKATVAADGTWTVTAGAEIPNAKYTLTVTATDPAGNATAATYTLTQAAK